MILFVSSVISLKFYFINTVLLINSLADVSAEMNIQYYFSWSDLLLLQIFMVSSSHEMSCKFGLIFVK